MARLSTIRTRWISAWIASSRVPLGSEVEASELSSSHKSSIRAEPTRAPRRQQRNDDHPRRWDSQRNHRETMAAAETPATRACEADPSSEPIAQIPQLVHERPVGAETANDEGGAQYAR